MSDTSGAQRSLAEMFKTDHAQFTWIAKQYYDLFSYHAAQRLTAFNFFLVSFSFFANAYATLITKEISGGKNYCTVAGVLAAAAYVLVISFGRLDKRNEQIIHINEKPLKLIQAAVRENLTGTNEDLQIWETFREAEKSYFFRTFGEILPFIYFVGASTAAAGSIYAFSAVRYITNRAAVCAAIIMIFAAAILIYFRLSKQRVPTE